MREGKMLSTIYNNFKLLYIVEKFHRTPTGIQKITEY